MTESVAMTNDYDLPLAVRYLDIMVTALLAGLPTNAAEYDAQFQVIEAFNEFYPPGTAAREAILFDAYVEQMVEAM